MEILGAIREPLHSRSLKLDETLMLSLFLLDLPPAGFLLHLSSPDRLLVNPDLMLTVLRLSRNDDLNCYGAEVSLNPLFFGVHPRASAMGTLCWPTLMQIGRVTPPNRDRAIKPAWEA